MSDAHGNGLCDDGEAWRPDRVPAITKRLSFRRWFMRILDLCWCMDPTADNFEPDVWIDNGSCTYSITANVTFGVDMNLYGDLGASTVFVNGGFNEWCGTCNAMSDEDEDGVDCGFAIGTRNN